MIGDPWADPEHAGRIAYSIWPRITSCSPAEGRRAWVGKRTSRLHDLFQLHKSDLLGCKLFLFNYQFCRQRDCFVIRKPSVTLTRARCRPAIGWFTGTVRSQSPIAIKQKYNNMNFSSWQKDVKLLKDVSSHLGSGASWLSLQYM